MALDERYFTCSKCGRKPPECTSFFAVDTELRRCVYCQVEFLDVELAKLRKSADASHLAASENAARASKAEAQVTSMVGENERMMMERNAFGEKANDLALIINEMRSMEIDGHKVGDIFDHMKRESKVGNPWAPNQDYPGKPVGKPICGIYTQWGRCIAEMPCKVHCKHKWTASGGDVCGICGQFKGPEIVDVPGVRG